MDGSRASDLRITVLGTLLYVAGSAIFYMMPCRRLRSSASPSAPMWWAS
jgi:hypothetical protein